MQQIDTTAIESFGIPRLLLMEHAGLAVARAVQSLIQPTRQHVLVCAGTGFNGGDGLAAARHLHGWGYPVRIVLTAPVSQLTGEPAIYATILQRLGVPFADANAIKNSALLIDALLGIGIHGAVREPAATLIRLMNQAGKPIVAVDVPSGLNADTGQVQGVAVRATTTVTFGMIKQGCLMNEGPAHTGSLIVDPITFPAEVLHA